MREERTAERKCRTGGLWRMGHRKGSSRRAFKPDGGIPRRRQEGRVWGGDRHGKSPWEKQGPFLKLERAREVISSVQSPSRVWLFATPWTAARQASLSFTNSRSLLKRMCIESAMPCNHLIAQWMKGRAVWDGQEPDPAETSRPWVTKNVSICPGTVASHWRVGNLGRDTIRVLFIKSGIIPAARCWGRDGERGFRTHLP